MIVSAFILLFVALVLIILHFWEAWEIVKYNERVSIWFQTSMPLNKIVRFWVAFLIAVLCVGYLMEVYFL